MKTARASRTDQTKGKSHGGYRRLKSFQTTTLIYDLTIIFCDRYIDKAHGPNRTYDQMVQAARSGRQNIAEGSQVSLTSKQMEIKLVSVARASLEELLNDFQDFLRQRGLSLWEKNDSRALSYKTDRTYETYKSYLSSPGTFANCLICLIHQANFLLDRQLYSLEEVFLTEGGYSENLWKRRLERRNTW